MSDPSRPLRPGRGSRSRPSPASLGIVKVDADFQDEYPGGDTTCTEAYASLCRTGEALLGELDRRIAATFGISQAAATALAVIDGAGTPLTPSQVSDRMLIASATMTATLDLLERRGWIRRVPNSADRRSVLIEITPEGRATTDQLLPGIRAIERSILSTLTHDERTHLLDLLAKILARTAEVAARPAEPLHGQRIRPRPAPSARHRARSPAGPRYCHGRIPAPQLNNTPKSQPGSPGTRHRLSRLPGVTGPRSWPPLRFWPRRWATTPPRSSAMPSTRRPHTADMSQPSGAG